MADLRGWGMSVPHLLPDAVVAFVDGELSASSHERAAAHLVGCPFCASEVAAQRQARAAVRAADTPSVPAGLLAALCDIPQHVDLPSGPDNLAITEDGQLVAVQRPDRLAGTGTVTLTGAVTPLGASPALGSSAPLGRGSAVLGRAAQGAGVVVSGLVLGALALVNPSGDSSPTGPVAGAPSPASVGAVVGAAPAHAVTADLVQRRAHAGLAGKATHRGRIG